MSWQPRTISGVFIGADGEPLVGATVSAQAVTMTAADGQTIVTRLPAASTTTNGAGEASLDVPTPETGTITYRIAVTLQGADRPDGMPRSSPARTPSVMCGGALTVAVPSMPWVESS